MRPSLNKHIVWFIPFRTVHGDTSWVIYTPVFPIFKNNKIFSSLHCISFIFVRFGGTRSVISWETIVYYPRYKLRGQIRLKDTTLSLGSDLLSNYCLYCRFVFFIFFVSVFERTLKKYNLKTNLHFSVLFVSMERTLLFVTFFFSDLFVRLVFALQSFLYVIFNF